MSPALATGSGEKLSIVLINGDKIYVRSGSYHTFLQDYQLYVKGTDTEGKRGTGLSFVEKGLSSRMILSLKALNLYIQVTL